MSAVSHAAVTKPLTAHRRARSIGSTVSKRRLPGAAGAASLASVVAISSVQIGRAHVCTPVTNAHLVCRLLLEKKKQTKHTRRTQRHKFDSTHSNTYIRITISKVND